MNSQFGSLLGVTPGSGPNSSGSVPDQDELNEFGETAMQKLFGNWGPMSTKPKEDDEFDVFDRQAKLEKPKIEENIQPNALRKTATEDDITEHRERLGHRRGGQFGSVLEAYIKAQENKGKITFTVEAPDAKKIAKSFEREPARQVSKHELAVPKPNKTDNSELQIRPVYSAEKNRNLTAVVNNYRQILYRVIAKDSKEIGDIKQYPTDKKGTPIRDSRLSDSEIEQVFTVLNKYDFNWFIAIKELSQEKTTHQLIRNIRQFEKELTAELNVAIQMDLRAADQDNNGLSATGGQGLTSDNDYSSVRKDMDQRHVVELLNEAVFNIFQLQPGILFDTNYYTAGKILAPKVYIPENLLPIALKQNKIQAKVKVVEHQLQIMIDDDWDINQIKIENILDELDWKNLSATDIEEFQQAFNIAFDRYQQIDLKMAEIRVEIDGEIQELEKVKSNDAEIKLRLLNLRKKQANLQMEAMNKLYVMHSHRVSEETNNIANLEIVQRGTVNNILLKNKIQMPNHNIQIIINDLLEQIQDGIPDEGITIKFDKTDVTFSSEELKSLKQTQNAMAVHTTYAIQFQSSATQFANEPYYSQSTIVDIVENTQVKQSLIKLLRSLGDKKMTEDSIKGFCLGFGLHPPDSADIKKCIDQNLSAEEIANVIIELNYPIIRHPEIFQHSAVENFGDVLKEFHHLAHDQPDTFLYRGSKYMHRSLSAGLEFVTRKSTEIRNSGTRVPPELTILQKQLEVLRNGITTLYGIRSNSDIDQETAAVDATRVLLKNCQNIGLIDSNTDVDALTAKELAKEVKLQLSYVIKDLQKI